MIINISTLKKYTNHSGFTLVEMLVSITILGIIATMAVPAMNNSYSTQKVTGLAERIQTDLVWARTQAILKSSPVTMTFYQNSSWCYGLEYDVDNNPATSACNCNSPSACLINGAQKTNNFAAYPNTTLVTTLPSTSITFDPRGLSNGANSTITISDSSSSVRITVNPIGKGVLCSNEVVQYQNCI